MKFYNTLSRTIEEFKPINPSNVKMYTCGPTVYHFAHIGNLRSYIMEDVLEKTLNFVGYKVNRVMNITDVGHLTGDSDTGEDKMLLGAIREKKSVLDIAKFYTDAFKKDCEELNIKWPDTVVPATSCIDEYIRMIETLLEKGYAYSSHGNIYFDVSKLDNYYTLTNHNADDMLVGVREGVEADEGKRNQADFALWFTKSKFADQELKWDSPWGVGYPGWHIECSGISCKYLGEYIDIHCGGVDNKFPHHTNEIAQSESYLGHKWCNYWCHVEHLNGENGKMSKSKGEFLTLSVIGKKGYSPMVYRLFCLQSHYRRQLVFSYEGMDMAKSAYEKLIKRLQKLQPDSSEINQEYYNKFNNQFKAALEKDLNTSLALTVLFDVLKSEANNNTKIALVKDFDKVLSLNLDKEIGNEPKEEIQEVDSDLQTYIKTKIEERKFAKQNKDYALADKIRSELNEKGIELIDTPQGTTFKIK